MTQFLVCLLTLLFSLSGPAMGEYCDFGCWSIAAKETADLYRAVGVREYESVMSSGKFLPGGGSLEGRQFAHTLEEAMKYADVDANKVAILKVTVPRDVLPKFDFSNAIDPHIFKSGVTTVQPGVQSDLLHQSIIGPIKHAF